MLPPRQYRGAADFVITFLVRHGDAGDKRTWDGPDAGRPLSPSGFRQAEGLVMRMEDYPVERILCSPTVRCHQTVRPLARDRLLQIEPVAALGVDADPTEILELFLDRRLRNAVLCTHGETIGRLFVQLAAQWLVAPEPLHWPKGSTWLLDRTDGRQVHARYLSPLALDRSVFRRSRESSPVSGDAHAESTGTQLTRDESSRTRRRTRRDHRSAAGW